MFICEICQKEYDTKQKLGGHVSSHFRGESFRKKRETPSSKLKKELKEKKRIHGYECKFCGKIYEKGQSLGAHIRMCPSNPLTAERRERAIKNMKITMSDEAWKSNHSKKVSDGVMKRVKAGTWHYSFSKTRTYEYNGVKFHGKWELQYAQWLDANNIAWRRPKERFMYIFENKEHYYTPDFYLLDSKEYVEIKGYETEKDRSKWKHFPYKLRVIKGAELKKLNIITIEQFKGLI